MTDDHKDPAERRHHGRTMQIEMRTRATPQQAWEAWANPAKIAQWFTDGARGEAKPGAQMTWIFDKFGEFSYDVVDAIPGQLLVLGGQLPDRPPFLLEVTITRDSGATVIRVVNSGFLHGGNWDEEYEGVASGWEMSLAVLKRYLEHHFGETKRTFLVMRETECAPVAMRPWFIESDRLVEWLASDKATTHPPSRVGSKARIPLQSGDVITGQTVAVTKREVAISWEVEHAVIELKAFTAGPKRFVGIRGTTWGASPERVSALEARFAPAVTRLVERLAEAPVPSR